MIKILFFIPTLMHGGAERVLINLVNNLDQNKYEITVQTLFDTGVHKDKLRKVYFLNYLEEVQKYFNCLSLNFYIKR